MRAVEVGLAAERATRTEQTKSVNARLSGLGKGLAELRTAMLKGAIVLAVTVIAAAIGSGIIARIP